MKFELGHWILHPGVEATYAVSIQRVQVERERLIVSVYSREPRGRGDLIGGSIFTITIHSPLREVIGVTMRHFKGLATFPLGFELTPGGREAVATGEDENSAWLTAGRLRVVVPKRGAWEMTFVRGEQVISKMSARSVGLFQKDNAAYLRAALDLQAGETVYGLGERFGALVKNGQTVEMWNEDGGAGSEWAYKNVPFFLTSQGYGVLVNHSGRVSFEVASVNTARVEFSALGRELEFYLFGGDTPKETLARYTALTGRPALPPEWSFGLWLSTSFTTHYDAESILAMLDRMSAEGIPVSVFHFDCFWMRELMWVSLLWDERNFPDPARLLAEIRARGIKVCVWINPYVAEASPLFAEGQRGGYFLKTKRGDVYQVDDWQPGLAFVDFTNPDACAWYAGKLKYLLEMGVDCFKTDFGERIPADAIYFNGADPEQMHNLYALLYNRTVFNVVRDVKGAGEAIVFARAAAAGSQQFPVHWGGDNFATYASMAATLRGGLSLGMCGFGFWSHDIGGFNDTATPDLYKRWVAFGALSSHSRLHGSDSPRVPWKFDEEAVAVLRHFAGIKQRLRPYWLETARHAHESGAPMMRAMFLEFPADPACRTLDQQYMLGDALLVAPVFSPEGWVEYYLPTGRWRHLLTGEETSGGQWRREQCDYFQMPLWVKESHWGRL